MNYHILNGDSLKTEFPTEISGRLLVTRECLVEGKLQGDSLEELAHNRAKFIQQAYGYSQESYLENVLPEFEAMRNIPADAETNLWFEHDLFCQVNLWFVASLLAQQPNRKAVFLVQPSEDSPYNFPAMGKNGLEKAYQNRIQLSSEELNALAKMFEAYRQDDMNKLVEIAEANKTRLPFLLPAVKAHTERVDKNGQLGRPKACLKTILEEGQCNGLYEILAEFTKREGIYGLGDLQVKRLLDELSSSEV